MNIAIISTEQNNFSSIIQGQSSRTKMTDQTSYSQPNMDFLS